jgi:hypothetical protein
MHLQIARKIFRPRSGLPVGSNDYLYEDDSATENFGDEYIAENESEINLPTLATANDLREVVKFFKYRPNGVSMVEVMNAEPRRVFDARKIAAYQFWGILSHSEDRLQLTPLGEELAKNTEIECEIHRRILRSVEAYLAAIGWIYEQKLKIATYLDIANFWQHSPVGMKLSFENEANIEAVIVSFFSLCHAAELGTATVGKRGQPARLSVKLKQVNSFLKSRDEMADFRQPPISVRPNIYHFEKTTAGNINRVYISGGSYKEAVENLCAALELADFESLAFTAEAREHEFLPASQLAAMRQCQAAVFLLDEKDCIRPKERVLLRCDRITEISVAQALFNERVIVLWNGETPPPSLSQTDLNFFTGESLDWETNVKLVKCLKSLKS